MIEVLVRAAGPVTLIVVLFALFRARWAWRTIILAVLLTIAIMWLTEVDGPISWLFQFATMIALPIQGALALLRGRRSGPLPSPLETTFADPGDRAQSPAITISSDRAISGKNRRDGHAQRSHRWSRFPDSLIPLIGFLLVVLGIMSLARFLMTELGINPTGQNAFVLITLLCASAVLIATPVVSRVFGDHTLKISLIGTALAGVAMGVRNFDDELQLAGSLSLAFSALGVWAFRLVRGRAASVGVPEKLAE